jgi:hypothetical protein
VTRLPDGFWLTHAQLQPRVLHAIDEALARVHKVDTPDGLPAELRAARNRIAVAVP